MDTPRLHLRKIAASDLNDFHEMWSNPKAAYWSTCGPKKTIEESQVWLKGILPENRNGDTYAVFVRSQPDRMIGTVGVLSYTPVAELAYTFHPDAWGQGYATEAVKAFLALYWKLRPSVDVVEAKTDPENKGSIGVLLKCGFKNVETLKDVVTLPSLGLRSAYLFKLNKPKTE